MPDDGPKIAILDEVTSNQIAAGEVIERPAAVVKELVENSIDAGAHVIQVEVTEGGKHLVSVSDDGGGMGQEDAILSLQRHATSKIQCADDLFRISTMGFRGEALPSIASVSSFSLTTKTDTSDSAGVYLHCSGGDITEVRPIGARPGTTITVENLFFNVPARLKFLKSASTELNHIVELIQRFALSYPAISFRLSSNSHEVFRSSGNGQPLDSALEVFGKDIARRLLPINHERVGVLVTGFAGSPDAMKGSRAGQHTFVNGRFVRNRAITRAFDEAYKSVQTIHGTRFPVAVLHITVDPGQIDVNVSPTKTEVRFTRESDVYSAVYHAVREGLMAGGLVPTAIDQLTSVPSAPSFQSRQLFSVPSTPAGTVRKTEPTAPVWTASEKAEAERAAGLYPIADSPFDDTRDYKSHQSGANRESVAIAGFGLDTDNAKQSAEEMRTTGADYRGATLDNFRILGQTRNTYIIAQTKHALLVIDQHIAHERVLYEKFVSGALSGATHVQHLVFPFTLELGKRESLVVGKRLDELAQAGFHLEHFGGDSYLVRAVPASVAQKRLKVQEGAEATLRSIIDEMVEKTVSRKLLLPSEEVLITASCKMAVKAGDPLNFEEMHALIDDLLKSDNPYTCPHGRPIIVELPNSDLDRKFGR